MPLYFHSNILLSLCHCTFILPLYFHSNILLSFCHCTLILYFNFATSWLFHGRRQTLLAFSVALHMKGHLQSFHGPDNRYMVYCQTPTPGETLELTLLSIGNKKKNNKNDPHLNSPRRGCCRV